MTKPITISVWQFSGGYAGDTYYVPQWYWNLETNHRIISESSEGYHRRIRALRGVEITLNVKPGSLQGLRPGQSKTIRRKHGDVTVRVESDV